MLAIRRCRSCGATFDVEVGTPAMVCPSCQDVLGTWDGVASGAMRRQPRGKHGESWEKQAQQLAKRDGAGDSDSRAVDAALRSFGGVHLSRRGR